jgi:hypothetical protein
MVSNRLSWFIAAAMLTLAGCDGGRTRPPSTNLLVVNAASSFPAIQMLRGQRSEANLDYRGSSSLTFDSDTYNFTLRVSLPSTSEPTVVETFTYDLAAESRHLFVWANAGGELEPILVSQPVFDPESSNVEYTLIHAAESVPAVDLYIEPPGTDINGALPKGTVEFLGHLAPATIDAGDYVITLTAAGDPTNVLLTSPTATLSGGNSIPLVIADGADEGLAPLYLIGFGSSAIIDTGIGSAIRVINGATDRAARDLFVNDDFAAPLVPAAPFGSVSEYADVAPGQTSITLTPAGNPSAIELEQTVPLTAGGRYSLLVSGDSGSLLAAPVVENQRRIVGQAVVRFMNTVNHYENVEIFLQPPGTDISTVLPNFVLPSPSATDRALFPPGSYELTMRASSTVINGPQTVTLSENGNYAAVMFDNADGSTIDVVLLEDFN